MAIIRASSTRWEWSLGAGKFNPFSALYLADPNPALMPCWNAGRFAPVSLEATSDREVRRVCLCPEMVPPSGMVGVVVVTAEERVAHCGLWHDGVWVFIDISPSSGRVRLEFVESPSWIALRALRFE